MLLSNQQHLSLKFLFTTYRHIDNDYVSSDSKKGNKHGRSLQICADRDIALYDITGVLDNYTDKNKHSEITAYFTSYKTIIKKNFP